MKEGQNCMTVWDCMGSEWEVVVSPAGGMGLILQEQRAGQGEVGSREGSCEGSVEGGLEKHNIRCGKRVLRQGPCSRGQNLRPVAS